VLDDEAAAIRGELHMMHQPGQGKPRRFPSGLKIPDADRVLQMRRKEHRTARMK
jgi:hypothetical protein